jgi:hypothetical protein
LEMPPGHNLGGVSSKCVQDRYKDDHKRQQVNIISAFKDF